MDPGQGGMDLMDTDLLNRTLCFEKHRRKDDVPNQLFFPMGVGAFVSAQCQNSPFIFDQKERKTWAFALR